MSTRDDGFGADGGRDELLPADVPGFDDPAYDDVRALLAEARVTEPVPADVAARLDRKLEELQHVRPFGSPDRGRRSLRLLGVAAAFVLVCGGAIGLQQIAENAGSGSDDSASAAADSGGVAEVPGQELAPSAPTPADGLVSARSQLRLKAQDFSSGESLRETLRSSAAAKASDGKLLANLSSTSAFDASGSPTGGDTGAAGDEDDNAPTPASRPACSPTFEGAETHPIDYEGKPAALVIYQPDGGKQLVEVRSCDGAELYDSTTVDAS